jgi:hypothetical protein
MGKYTSLARNLEEEVHNTEVSNNKSVKINNINNDTASYPVGTLAPTDTPLRGNAVNAVNPCIHKTTEDRCAVCSGYVRWLVADKERLRAAQAHPESTRREFWRQVWGRL